MKKRILGLLVAMTLVLAYAIPVAAADTSAAPADVTVATETVAPNGADKVSDDPAVQEAYDAYFEVAEALRVHEYGPMKDALDKYNSVTAQFTDAQSDAWTELVYDELRDENVLGTLIDATLVESAVAQKEAYQKNPNAKTAVDFVDAYDACVNAGIEIEYFEAGIKSVYEIAKETDLPKDNAKTVYDAYVVLDEALGALEAGFYDEYFVKACEEFEAVLDIFNELTDEEMADLAWLMGVKDAEEVYSIILCDWINANLGLKLGALFDAYQNDPEDVDAATEFVKCYEEILNDTEILTDEDKTIILTSFEAAYEGAKAFLAESGADADDAVTDSDKSDKDTSTETGDDFNAAPYAALMVIAAAAAALAVKRRKVQ